MPYRAYIAPEGPWLALDFEGAVRDEGLVAARHEAAKLNAEGRLRDFILDFGDVDEFVLENRTVERFREVDCVRAPVLLEGRCAIVARREVVEIAAKYLAMVSQLDLDFRVFRERAAAEAWLRGEGEPPPPLLRAPKGQRGAPATRSAPPDP